MNQVLQRINDKYGKGPKKIGEDQGQPKSRDKERLLAPNAN